MNQPSSFLLLMYSISFFMGALVQGTVNAMIFSASVILLLIMVPLVLPPLQWMSINVVGDLVRDGYRDTAATWIPFIVTTAVFSGLLLWLSGVVLKRRVRLSVDQRVLCGWVVTLCLLFVAAVAFPLGTNMIAEQKIVLPRQHRGYVYDVIPDANQALVLYSDAPEKDSAPGRKFAIARVDLTKQKNAVGQTIVVADPGSEEGVSYGVRDLMWSHERPQLAYALIEKKQVVRGRQDRQRSLSLCTISLKQSESSPILHRISLDNEMDEYLYPQACLLQERIYVYDYRRMLVYGLEEARTPILLHSQEIDSTGRGKRYGVFLRGAQRDFIKLLPVSQLADQGRMELTQQLLHDGWCLSANQQVALNNGAGHRGNMGLTLFKTGPAKNGAVTLVEQGRQGVRPVDRLLDFIIRPHEIRAHNERAFCMSRYGVTVYDIADPNHIQRLGHYAAGEAFVCMAPLGHDRLIIGGENLHILRLADIGK